jgi:hypothetical protein
MRSVELTILDNDAHCRNAIALAPGRWRAGDPGGPHGCLSSSTFVGGSSTVTALVNNCGRRPRLRAVTLK